MPTPTPIVFPRISRSIEDIRAGLYARIDAVQNDFAARGWLPRRLNLNKGVIRGLIELYAWGKWQIYNLLEKLLKQAVPHYSSGEWLDLHAQSVGLVRKQETKTKGKVCFYRREIRNSGFAGRGLPIGSLTSQWLANLYLDSLDHFVKDDLGVKHYVRYMDDFILVGPDKEWSRATLAQIGDYLAGLELALNPKTGIRPITQGVDFVGYRHWTSHTLPRKRTVKRAKHVFKTLQAQYNAKKVDFDYVRARVVSFTGYMKHCNGRNTLNYMLEKFVLTGAGKPPEPIETLHIPR